MNENILHSTIRFFRDDDVWIQPSRMKNRDDGRFCFRLTRGGAGSNTKGDTYFAIDEDDVLQKVRAGWFVRCRAAGSSACNLYSIHSRRICRVEGVGR